VIQIAKLEEMMASVPPADRTTRPMSTSGTFVGPPDHPDEYQLVTLVGSGGEAQVWRALTRPEPASPVTVTVAVKIFTAELDAAQASDWLRRTQSARHIHNPALAQVHAAFIGAPMHPRSSPVHPDPPAGPVVAGCRYLVMEFVDGPSLLEWVEDHPDATLRERLRLLLTLAAGLDALHAGSSTVPPVAHGDVKPDNARLTPDGGVKLVDFGLLRIQGTSRSGPAMATLPYTAPEFFAAGEHAVPTPEADRFAFAATVFHVLTGVVPVLRADRRGPDLSALRPILERTPLTAGRPEVLATVMSGLLADPAARPAQLVPWLAAARRTETATVSQFAAGPASAPQPTVPMPGLPSTTSLFPAPAPAPGRPSAVPVAASAWDQPADGEIRGRRRAGSIVGIVVLLLVLAVIVLLWKTPLWSGSPGDNQAGRGPTSHGSTTTPATSKPTGSPGSNSGKGSAGSGSGSGKEKASTGTPTVKVQATKLTRRTLAIGEYLNLHTGVVGTQIDDNTVNWDGTYVYAPMRRLALIPAITTEHACEARLRQRQDSDFITADKVRGGKAVCVITLDGSIAAVRITAIDVRSRATFEYVVW
jgi:serine/threonine protein kinase